MAVTVRDTVILQSRVQYGPDGKAWKAWEIAWPGMRAAPGQFVMLRGARDAYAWPAPLMIWHETRRGFIALAHPNSPLYALDAHDAVTVWGPCGKSPAIPEGEGFTVIADAAGLLLAAPLLLSPACRGVGLIGPASEDTAWLTGALPITRADTAGAIAMADSGTIIAALPLEQLALLKAHAPEGTLAFVGAKVGCGIGACRGCYIHAGDGSTGIAVCQEGPFLPMRGVDWQKDQNFLAHFV